MAARTQAIRHLRSKAQAAGSEDLEETTLLSKLMAYCSKEAHSCVEKAAMIGFVRLRILEPDENCDLRGDILKQVKAKCSSKADMSNATFLPQYQYPIFPKRP